MTAPRNGRKPAQLELAGGKSPRQLAWETIRARRDSFTLNDVACYADIDIQTAKAYLQALERGGYISSTSPRRNTTIAAKTYRLANDCGVDAPRLNRHGQVVNRGIGNTNMWRVIRMSKSEFDYHSIARDASTPEHQIAPSTAKNYLLALEQAGYLDIVQPSQGKPGGGNSPCRLRLRPIHPITGKAPGPRAPMVQLLKTVYDPNWAQIVQQEAPHHD
ncbi:hypothetical protein [Chromobacterium haemolyticum]|uniref:hypothetical protein n=1 Tax=Chromobacterium haemolyticum TaxID=394935 RepID=UPI000D312C36|nr:hypothetical protein [Chromobacterium haemolyticum]PTU68798.1 hypothetical protein DBB33_04755 [Chromobacterium haemolyticum]